MDTVYFSECYELIRRLNALASSIRVRPCHWISTPDGDEGHEWCPDCGYYMVRHMRRRDRKRRDDYILDGGWRTDHDNTVFCAGCGVRLSGGLTSYGASEEVYYYANHAPSPCDPDAAWDLAEVLSTFEYVSEDCAQSARDAIGIVRCFLAESSAVSASL